MNSSRCARLLKRQNDIWHCAGDSAVKTKAFPTQKRHTTQNARQNPLRLAHNIANFDALCACGRPSQNLSNSPLILLDSTVFNPTSRSRPTPPTKPRRFSAQQMGAQNGQFSRLRNPVTLMRKASNNNYHCCWRPASKQSSLLGRELQLPPAATANNVKHHTCTFDANR
jgi:hypothetical protein